MSWLLQEIMDKLKDSLEDARTWPDMESYYQARRLFYRLRTIAEKEQEKAEREAPLDTYGGND